MVDSPSTSDFMNAKITSKTFIVVCTNKSQMFKKIIVRYIIKLQIFRKSIVQNTSHKTTSTFCVIKKSS